MSDTLFSDSPTNAPEYTVSEISGALKRTVEDAFGNVRVRGEISGYRGPHGSGHAYFALKDDRAKLEAVIWKTTMGRLRFRPEEGMEVIARGKLTTYPGSSKYQIVIEALEPAGAGALMALLEERKRKLAAEGLFAEARKRRPPYLPGVIGVVTSPTGAVIRDILHRIRDRFPLHVVVWPVRVQGDTCASEVAAAIEGFNALAAGGVISRPDLLIVARGGGSLEDLWGFNDEALARVAAASGIPIISAIGHETDWTLLDLVADVRAPTPTGAAELAVPVRAELQAGVASLSARLRGCVSRSTERKKQALRAAARILPTPDQLFALPRRRLDEAASRLARAVSVGGASRRARLQAVRLTPSTLVRRFREARRHLVKAAAQLPKCAAAHLRKERQRLESVQLRLTPEPLSQRLRSTRREFDRVAGRLPRGAAASNRNHRARIEGLARRLRPELVGEALAVRARRIGLLRARFDRLDEGILDRRKDRIAQADRLLQTLSYQAVLRRGFAVVRDFEGQAVMRGADIAPRAKLSLEFADQAVAVTADSPDEPLRPRPRGEAAVPAAQGRLL